MGSSAPSARGHLRLLASSDQQQHGTAREPARVDLGPAEWTLALADGNPVPPPPVIRDLLSRVLSARPRPAGRQPLIERAAPALLEPWASPALLHHNAGETILYCRSDQLTAQAADCITALAARAAEFVRPVASREHYEITVARVHHRDLPADLHPAVATVRRTQITLHVCARVITHELAVAMSDLLTAYAGLRAGVCQAVPSAGLPASI